MLDIFNSDAFSVVPLTDAIQQVKFVPGRLGQLGIFSTSGVATTSVAIEERDGLLTLVSPTPRGGPGQTIDKIHRTMRNVSIPHFEINDAIMAEEVQGIRAWGSDTQLETVQGKVLERGALHSQSMAATEEYARVGAIKGLVTYADNSTLDLFNLFGVTQEAEIDFDLDNATPGSGALRLATAQAFRIMASVLEGIPFSGIYAICGDAFFDDLIRHPEVRATYANWEAAADLRQGYVQANGLAWGGFNFGGIIWDNYRGSVGGTSFVHTDKCHLIPQGVPNLFRTYFAPADYIETVNTIGQRLYARQYPMPNGKGVAFDVQMNALSICTRPRCLLQGKRT